MEGVLSVGQSLNQCHSSLAGKLAGHTWTWMLVPKHTESLDILVPTQQFLLIGLGEYNSYVKNYLSSIRDLWASSHREKVPAKPVISHPC